MQKYSQILGTSRSSITTVILYVNCVTLCFHSNTFALFHLHKYHCQDTLQHFIISNRISPKMTNSLKLFLFVIKIFGTGIHPLLLNKTKSVILTGSDFFWYIVQNLAS